MNFLQQDIRLNRYILEMTTIFLEFRFTSLNEINIDRNYENVNT